MIGAQAMHDGAINMAGLRPDGGHPGRSTAGRGGHLGARGRGWGRGAHIRRQPIQTDPEVLERRRKSTAAIVQRQLDGVLICESLAGQKVCRYARCWHLAGLHFA